jgi:pimeloyl-ACP methyl ester carboxylesterase
MRLGPGERVDVPTAFMASPADLFPPPPDEWIGRVYRCVRRTERPRGGHFAALESPEEFVRDVREFFRAYR